MAHFQVRTLSFRECIFYLLSISRTSHIVYRQICAFKKKHQSRETRPPQKGFFHRIFSPKSPYDILPMRSGWRSLFLGGKCASKKHQKNHTVLVLGIYLGEFSDVFWSAKICYLQRVIVINGVIKWVHAGRLTAGTYSHHPFRKEHHLNQTCRELCSSR